MRDRNGPTTGWRPPTEEEIAAAKPPPTPTHNACKRAREECAEMGGDRELTIAAAIHRLCDVLEAKK